LKHTVFVKDQFII